jgi:hypothetical protein
MIRCPTLVLCGREDKVTPPAASHSTAFSLREDSTPVANSEPAHPTRREDGRTPNPRLADKALAADLNVPVESLMLFDTPDASDAKHS